MKDLFIDDLVIEVTRKCNAKCPHCLRGECENVDINFSYIEKLLKGVVSIGTITFSGGEPTLNVDIIGKTLEYVKDHDISVDSIYVVTNALHYSQKLVKYMRKWLEYCMSCTGYDEESIWWTNEYGEIYKSKELEDYLLEFPFGLSVSIDKYHPTPSDYALKRYKNLPYYSNAKETDFSKGGGLIVQGRAAHNGLGKRKLNDWEYYFSIIEDESDSMRVESIYLNSLGQVFPNCDFSYETQAQAIGNISIANRSLCEILEDEDNIRYDYFNVDKVV